jgi:hypothetical protein
VKRLQPEKPGSPAYRQIWRIVDGAVASAFAAHPDYVASNKRLRTVRNSIVKRVVGAVTSHAEQSARVRSGSSPAHERPAVALTAAVGGIREMSPDDCRCFTVVVAGEVVQPSPAPSLGEGILP